LDGSSSTFSGLKVALKLSSCSNGSLLVINYYFIDALYPFPEYMF